MGKVIKMFSDLKSEQKENVKQLKKLVEKYIPENKKFVVNKIKNEQQ